MFKKSYREPESNIRLGIPNNNTFAPVKGNYWKKGIEACKSGLIRKKTSKTESTFVVVPSKPK